MSVLAPVTFPQRRRVSFPRPLARVAPLVSIVIVNYRRWEETAALVDQLLDDDSFHRDQVELLIVDNASPHHPLEDRLRRDRRVRIHRLRRNRGFGAGVNAGARLTRGHWLLVLNPDLSVCPGFLDLICAAARDFDDESAEDRPVGVVGFQLRNRDGSHQLSTGLFPTLGKLLAGLLRPRTQRKYRTVDVSRRQSVAWVAGSCVLVRRACLRQLAGFDEEFFLYYEDVDFCLRAQAKGWSVCYEPAVQAIHLDPLQNRRLTEPLRAITRHASLTYFRKHLAGWQFWSLAQLVRAEAWLRQRVAEWRGRKEDAQVCHQLRGICREFMRQRPEEARKRLEILLRQVGMNT